LSKLWRKIGQKQGGQWVVQLKCATRAALHQGTTKLITKKDSVGSVEDCYAFIPYETPQGYELNIMEVQGIAVATWQEDEQDDDIEEDEDAQGQVNAVEADENPPPGELYSNLHNMTFLYVPQSCSLGSPIYIAPHHNSICCHGSVCTLVDIKLGGVMLEDTVITSARSICTPAPYLFLWYHE
jgi:hypothetical protein